MNLFKLFIRSCATSVLLPPQMSLTSTTTLNSVVVDGKCHRSLSPAGAVTARTNPVGRNFASPTLPLKVIRSEFLRSTVILTARPPRSTASLVSLHLNSSSLMALLRTWTSVVILIPWANSLKIRLVSHLPSLRRHPLLFSPLLMTTLTKSRTTRTRLSLLPSLPAGVAIARVSSLSTKRFPLFQERWW